LALGDSYSSAAGVSPFVADAPPDVQPLDAQPRPRHGGADDAVFVSSLFGCATVSATDVLGNPCQQMYGTTFTDQIVNQTYPHLVAALTAVRQKALRRPWSSWATRRSCRPSASRPSRPERGSSTCPASSTGHDACQPTGARWVQPAIAPVNAFPVQPNATGEAAMAGRTLLSLGR
jgi:hypothetical protein